METPPIKRIDLNDLIDGNLLTVEYPNILAKVEIDDGMLVFRFRPSFSGFESVTTVKVAPTGALMFGLIPRNEVELSKMATTKENKQILNDLRELRAANHQACLRMRVAITELLSH